MADAHHPAATTSFGVPAGFEELTFVEPHEVVSILNSSDKDNVVVIDVREESDFADGHISNAKNIPSGKFADTAFVQQLVEEHKDKTLVVHCMKSQHRGPTCGRALSNALDKLAGESQPKV